MAKSKLERGFYPISLTFVKQLLNNCEQWNYGNKDTCRYIAEVVIERLQMDYEDLPIKDTLYSELIGIAHDLNAGGKPKSLEISLV